MTDATERRPPADSKVRFSSRVADYVRYRPSYPPQVVDLFREALGLTPQWAIADVGSGTGISAELLLRNGNMVFCVEPNADMRRAAEDRLATYPGFRSTDGPAEATTLPDRSVEMVLCAQAFHWFDPAATRREFARILKPGGWVVLMWNSRKTTGNAFSEGYDKLLYQYGADYAAVKQSYVSDDAFVGFFGARPRFAVFPNAQTFDFEGLRGRMLSSSYAPLPGHPSHDPLLHGLRELFDRHQQGGKVTFEYDTELHYGRLT